MTVVGVQETLMSMFFGGCTSFRVLLFLLQMDASAFGDESDVLLEWFPGDFCDELWFLL